METFEAIVLAVATYDEIMAKSIKNNVFPSDEEVYEQIMAQLKKYGYKEKPQE